MSQEIEEMPRSRRHEAYELLPKHFPGGELLGLYADVLRRLSGETKDYTEDELRAIHWTIALGTAFERSRLAATVPGFQMTIATNSPAMISANALARSNWCTIAAVSEAL